MMITSRTSLIPTLAAALALAIAGAASAQTTMPSGSSTQGGMNGMQGMQGMQNMKCMEGMSGTQCMKMHMHMKGMHTMQAIVTSADAKTGIVEVNAEGMALKLHFPGLSSGDLKSGDKITVMMAYSKP